jgi:hypothetical protein
MDPNNRNLISLDKLSRLLDSVETALGLQQTGNQPKEIAENLYAVTKELYFSVPQSADQDQLSDGERDQIFQQSVLGRMSKQTFLKQAQARIKSLARYQGREAALKKIKQQQPNK